MTTMREKIARALAADAFQRQASDAEKRRGPSAFLDGWWNLYLGTADAVLDAMRDMTDLMGNGLPQGYRAGSHSATQIWTALIDAAKEGS